MNKIVNPGRTEDGQVFCKIVFESGRLSISGVEGPKPNGDCRGSCGQIAGALRLTVDNLNPGWDAALVNRFADVWEEWHLNDMRAGTPRQTVYLRAQPPTSYAQARDALAAAGLNPDNGYRYGSAWLREEVPAEVISFLKSLPVSERTPAWI